MKVLVTGSNGFLGSRLCEFLTENGIEVIGYSRQQYAASYKVVNGELFDDAALSEAMVGIDIVVHCAARAHIAGGAEFEGLDEYRHINVQGSKHVAKAAINAKVSRMIFISSIKVNGEETPVGHAFNHLSEPAPEDSYGLSKWEAEQALWALVHNTSLELVIVRPPLLYGEGVKGNLEALSRLLSKPILLPFGAIHNQRSFLYIGNFIDLIVKCFDSPMASGQTFLVSDDNDVSNSDLFQQIKRNVKGKAILLPVHVWFLRFAFRLLGKRSLERKLLGNLQVDCSYVKQQLAWQPPYRLGQAMEVEKILGDEID